LELEVLCQRLQADFGAAIQGQGANDAERQRNFYSRALPAFVLTRQAGADAGQAAAAIVDGGFDHGIDAVFVGADLTVWVLQSKYIDAGIGEPELGEVHKFCTGVRDLLRGQWARFNAALQAKTAELQRALNDEACRVQVILVHTGGAIADDRRVLFGDLETDFNAPRDDFVQTHAFGLSALHDLHLDGLAPAPIAAEFELRDFGFVAQPYQALYGRLSAQRLAELGQQHGDALVERNLRRFKGSTSVNEGLTATLREHADHFFYFNNGVTFLCESFNELHPRDDRRRQGRFNVRGLSIINGAQTVGAIAREPVAHYAAHPSEVLATFVCLQNAPDGFGDQVTQYRNRQNAVDIQDFAALDERQQQWRQTLGLAGIEYVCKHGENDPAAGERVFGIRDAAAALACCVGGRDWAEFVVAANADRKRLFKREPSAEAGAARESAYARVFYDALTAKELWRAVQVGRLVDEAIRARAAAERDPADLPAGTLRAADVLREGRWLALHMLFIKTGLRRGANLNLSAEERDRVSRAVDAIAQAMVAAAQGHAWGKQARAVFENRADCATLKALVMEAVPQGL
jgi:hypothetical protein